MSDKPDHILNLLYDKLLESERNLARFKAEGWVECVEAEERRLDDLRLLYDAVDQGLLDKLREDFGAALSWIMAVAA